MSTYRRLSLVDRCQIDAFLSADFSISEIAKRLGFNKSTISREIDRNFSQNTYLPKRANELAIERYRQCRKQYRLKGTILELVKTKLAMGWSPEQICGRLAKESQASLCHETIYRLVRRDKVLRGYLRRINHVGAGRSLQRRAQAKKRSILRRPKAANDRQRTGDWERDTFFCAKRKPVLILTDRRSRLTKLKRMQRLDAPTVAEHTNKVLATTGKKPKTITNDNGTEFNVSQVNGIKVYYCEPRKPQQRGTVENTIGLIRQYLNRKTDLDLVEDQKINEIETLLNLRPRKCLDFKTPYEVFYNQNVALAM